MRHGVRLIALLVALAMLAAGCGGGEDSDEATTTTTVAPGDAGNTDTTVADATTTTTTQPEASGDGDSEWCRQLRIVSEEAPPTFNFLTATADELRERFEGVLDSFMEAADIAPPEIEADVEVMVEAYGAFVARGNELEWSINALANDAEFAASFDDPAISAAADRMDAYSRDVCDVDFTALAGAPSSGPIGPGTGEVDEDDPVGIVLNALGLPRALFTDEQVACVVEELGEDFVESITPEWTPTAEAVEVLLAAVDACGIALG